MESDPLEGIINLSSRIGMILAPDSIVRYWPETGGQERRVTARSRHSLNGCNRSRTANRRGGNAIPAITDKDVKNWKTYRVSLG